MLIANKALLCSGLGFATDWVIGGWLHTFLINSCMRCLMYSRPLVTGRYKSQLNIVDLVLLLRGKSRALAKRGVSTCFGQLVFTLLRLQSLTS